MPSKLSSSSGKEFRALTVDFGTTRCKAAVIDARGGVLALAAAENSLLKKGEGIYEQEAIEFEQSLARCLRRVLARSRRSVDVVVVTGQGSAPICLDDSGKPVAPVISHFDTRAGEERRAMREEVGNMGYVDSKIFPNLLWMKKNETGRFRRVKHVLDVREYVGYLLTGKYTHDVWSLEQGRIDELSAYVGIDSEAFGGSHDYAHAVGSSSSRAERRFGIKKGVPVLQAPGDTVCAAVGSGLGRSGTACDVAGSTEVVAALVPEGMLPTSLRLYQIPHVAEGRSFLFMSPPHGFIFKWFVDTFYGQTPKERRYAAVDREVAGVQASDTNPIFVPLIGTGGFSYRIESQFFQIGISHTRANLARSVMEGLAMRVRMALDGIRESGIGVEKVRLSGGGATSEVWNQIRTDIFGMDSELIQTREASSLGAGMIAAVAAGAYGDIFKAEEGMVHVTKHYTPRKAFAGLYDAVYEDFRTKLETLEKSEA